MGMGLLLVLLGGCWKGRLGLGICIKIRFIIRIRILGFWQLVRITKDINGKQAQLLDLELQVHSGIKHMKDLKNIAHLCQIQCNLRLIRLGQGLLNGGYDDIREIVYNKYYCMYKTKKAEIILVKGATMPDNYVDLLEKSWQNS